MSKLEKSMGMKNIILNSFQTRYFNIILIKNKNKRKHLFCFYVFITKIIITIITAAGRDSLLSIGVALVAAAIIHNALGYFFGYWGCRFLRLPEKDCRTIALEVGMQNGGLASGIALEMGKVATIGLAPAVFGPWMNISGSSLATWWGERDPEAQPKPSAVVEQESLD